MDVLKVIDENYDILHEIKRGGFGVVYYGRDRLFGKPVAIKAISPELLGEAKYIDMFQAEALHIARLSHHNIVRLYDVKRTSDGQFYLIMEYIDGVDLNRLVAVSRREGRTLPRHLALYIVTEACSGLEYAHTRRDPETHEALNIVHRDVSPSNIMITRSGEVKLIDFGMAGIRQRRSTKSREVVVQGKIGYLAPEQVDGTSEVDRRADIFSLGIVLFELLTGERFIKTENPAEAVDILRNGRWSLDALDDLAIPEALTAATKRALQLRPDTRYPSMNQFFLDLMNYQAKTNSSDDFASELEEFVASLPLLMQDSFDGIDFSDIEADGTTPAVQSKPVADQFAKASKYAGASDDNGETSDTVAGINALREDTPALRTEKNGHERPAEESVANDFASIAAELDASLAAAEKRPAKKAPRVDSPFYNVVEDEDDNEVRTIIDVVRLSARSHRKAILATLGSLVGSFLLFTGLDTAFQWTTYGGGIYDAIFPPAIRIVSFPAGANVFLDDKAIAQPTPVAIEKISPGVHKLTLTLPGFDPVIKSIQVPPKGKIKIAGQEVPLSNQPYVFRFKIQIELSSNPPDAEVFLNGMRYTQTTPCRVVWEVGDPLQIEMEKSGFQRLAGMTLNTTEGAETIEDRRLWRFQRIEEQREYYAVTGIFAKAVTISSLPSKAEIYLDGGSRPVGVSGYNDRLLLTVGAHNITLKKSGYLAKSFSVRVDENSPSKYSEVLQRVVRILAKNAMSSSDDDIGARIVQLDSERGSTRVRATTPAQFTLMPYAYTAILTREGYDNFILSIPPSGNVAVARMQPHLVSVEVVVFDETTSQPLDDVQISQQALDAKDVAEKFFNKTDSTGVAIAELPVGQYRLRVKKPGYREQSRELSASQNSKNRIIFKMSTLGAGNR
jgi:serine/threonine protein kinase